MKLHIFLLSERSVLNTVQWFLVYAPLLCIYIFFSKTVPFDLPLQSGAYNKMLITIVGEVKPNAKQ